MGYSYTADGKLCCDSCGKAGEVRKQRCPFGWCPARALCPECRRKKSASFTKEYHRKSGCEERSKEFDLIAAGKQSMLEQGKFVRASALSHHGKVKVLFRGLSGEIRAYFMSPKTYNAIPLLENALVEDYRVFGRVTKAKSIDIYNPV